MQAWFFMREQQSQMFAGIFFFFFNICCVSFSYKLKEEHSVTTQFLIPYTSFP